MLAGPLPSGTYYIYSFDGRLLAEYNLLGQVVRDYVYFGGQLVAENKNGVLHYYVSDRINSTRIVTDSTGTVVYSAAHEPYGGIQKTRVTTAFDPEPKFSGQPRDAESGLDYFGARYYDRSLYRFLSADPLIGEGRNLAEPQSWNCYSYCQNDPIGRIEIQGLWSLKLTVRNIHRIEYGDMTPVGAFPIPKLGLTLCPYGDAIPFLNSKDEWELAFELSFDIYILEDSQLTALKKEYGDVLNHEIACHVKWVGRYVAGSLGRIEKKWKEEKGKIGWEKARQNALNRLYKVTRRAEIISKIIFDEAIFDIFERIYTYWGDVDANWIPVSTDYVMAWALRCPI